MNVALEYAKAAHRALIDRGSHQYQDEIKAARENDNHFCEFAFEDKFGDPIVQAWHHCQFQYLTNHHRQLVMWYPIEHGKTTQTKMKLLSLLGKHPDRQYAVIGAQANTARKTLGACKREIDANPKLRMVYPNLRAQQATSHAGREQWGNTAIRVEGCPYGSPDPSLAAYGLDGGILGSRLHGAILDNILDSSNTNTQDQRAKTVDKIKDEIIGRIVKGGFIWILDTAWHIDDALHVLGNEPEWHSVKFDAEVGETDDEPTLWPVQFPPERLAKKRRVLTQIPYNRQFKNMPLTETLDYFKEEHWNTSYGRCAWLDTWDASLSGSGLQVRTGVDLAVEKGSMHDLTVFTTVVAKGHRRQVVNIRAGRMHGNEILKALVMLYKDIHDAVNRSGGHAKFVVEDNAAQKYIVHMMRDAAILRTYGLTPTQIGDIKVTGRTTTSKKRDPEIGVQSLASGIEMGRWDFAAHHETRELRREMEVWSPEAKHYGDRLMSLWLASADLQSSMPGDWTVDYV